jgi:ubiquinone/menaquinone biosynthesis C-methylase UbiE
MIGRDYRKHVLEFYNRMAAFYDLGELVRRDTRRKTVALCAPKPDDKVLDVCTGTGDLALAFASNGIQVTGIDISTGMLRQAARKDRLRRLTWLEMDASCLYFRDKHFDISTISLGLHHMPEAIQWRVLSEMARVTRRHVAIVELNAPSNPRWRPIWAAIFKLLDESEYISEWSQQDLVSTCRRAGLEIERRIVTTLGMHRLILCSPEGRGNGLPDLSVSGSCRSGFGAAVQAEYPHR